jgi:uncharacterized cofD-like protein
MKKIVVIGGGTGTFTVLSGLKKYPVELSAIVSMADDGGSTGVLRDELGVLPPGDIRQCLVALSHSSKTLRELFSYRFEAGGLAGHSFGNLFLSALEKIHGNFEDAVLEAGRLLGVRGAVIPVTLEKTRLLAELENGEVLRGEHVIDETRPTGNLRIRKVWLEPSVHATYRAVQAIESADLIVMGPGDLYTSIIPNLLVQGIAEALRRTSAKILYVVNLMTKFGQTNNFTAKEFLNVIESFVGKNIVDYVMVNTAKPGEKLLGIYAEQKEFFVEPRIDELRQAGYKVVEDNFVNRVVFEKSSADTLKRSLIRHDYEKLAQAILTRCLQA